MTDLPDPDELDLTELDAYRFLAEPRVPTASLVWLFRGLAERIRAGATSPKFAADVLDGAADGLQRRDPTSPKETP